MFDLSNFYEELDNDKESIEIILEAYIDEYADYESKIHELNENKDWSGLHLAAHSLKGILSSFGEQNLTIALENIEAKTHANTAPDAADIKSVCQNLPDVKIFIQKSINEL